MGLSSQRRVDPAGESRQVAAQLDEPEFLTRKGAHDFGLARVAEHVLGDGRAAMKRLPARHAGKAVTSHGRPPG
jgi:hypothetical protein